MNNVNVKLSVYNNNRIIIENYFKLLDLTENLIKVDIYNIIGDFLKVKAMDAYMIEITGVINKIVIEGKQ